MRFLLLLLTINNDKLIKLYSSADLSLKYRNSIVILAQPTGMQAFVKKFKYFKIHEMISFCL